MTQFFRKLSFILALALTGTVADWFTTDIQYSAYGEDATPAEAVKPTSNEAKTDDQKKAADDAKDPQAFSDAKFDKKLKRAEVEQCISDESLFVDLRQKRDELKKKEKTLMDREAELATREKVIQERLKQLDDMQKDLKKMKDVQDSKNEERVSKLVETLEKMSPKKSSEILSNVDDKLALQAMNRISTDKFAKIMNSMDPKRAAELSELLATGKMSKTKPEKKGGGES